MKIMKLQAENIKRLTAVEITPDGAVVKISGKNASGKTSVLDSIWWAMGGGDNIQDKPIRKGAEKGKITLDLGDLQVERRFTEKGTQLFVTNKEGARFPSPQAVLDKLVGTLTFDPLEFMRLKPKDQLASLRSIVSIGDEIDKLDAKRKDAFDERTIVNRAVKEKAGACKNSPVDPDAPEEVVSAADLMTQIQQAEDSNRQLDSLKSAITSHETAISDMRDQITELESQIKMTQNKVDEANKHLEGREHIDATPLRLQLAGIEDANDRARRNQQAIALRDEHAALLSESEAHTAAIEKIDKKKAELMAATEFPADGLSFADGAVMYNDLPLEQASAAEQLRVSMSIAMAANPEFRVIRITDGSLMDSTSFDIIEKMAEEKDYQIWVEVVDETGDVGVVIDDGHVAKVN